MILGDRSHLAVCTGVRGHGKTTSPTWEIFITKLWQ